jgi:hypothetical protein
MRVLPEGVVLFALATAGARAQDDGFVVHAVAIACDASAAAFGRVTNMGGDGCLLLRAAAAAEPMRLRDVGIVRGIVWAGDAQSLFASQDDGAVLHVGTDGELLHTFELGRLPGFCRGLAISRDGATLAAIDDENRVQCFDVASGERRLSRQVDALPLCALFLPNGRLAVGDNAGTVSVYSADGERTERHHLVSSNVMALAADEAGRRLAAGAWNGSITVLDLASGERRERPATRKRIYAIAFSPDGAHLAVAGEEPGVLVWHLDTQGESGAEERWPAPQSIGALLWRRERQEGELRSERPGRGRGGGRPDGRDEGRGEQRTEGRPDGRDEGQGEQRTEGRRDGRDEGHGKARGGEADAGRGKGRGAARPAELFGADHRGGVHRLRAP